MTFDTEAGDEETILKILAHYKNVSVKQRQEVNAALQQGRKKIQALSGQAFLQAFGEMMKNAEQIDDEEDQELV